MNVERDLTILIGVLSILSVGWNIGVLVYVYHYDPLKTELASARPLARGLTKAFIGFIALQTLYLINETVVSLVRNLYTLPVLTREAPAWVVWATLEQQVVKYGVPAVAAYILLVLVWSFRQTDHLSEVQLKAKREIATRRR